MKNYFILLTLLLTTCLSCKHTVSSRTAYQSSNHIEGFWSDAQRKTCWVFEKNDVFLYGRQDSAVHVFMCGQYHLSDDEIIMSDRLNNRLVYDFFLQADTLWIRSGEEAIKLLRSQPMRIINNCTDTVE